jgi:hypothetical protein
VTQRAVPGNHGHQDPDDRNGQDRRGDHAFQERQPRRTSACFPQTSS